MLHHRAQLIFAMAILLWLAIFGLVKCASAEPALAPFGHTGFCLRYPEQCKVREGSIGSLSYLQRINIQVNRSIKASPAIIARQVAMGRDVDWLASPPEGVCHDYAVTKQALLLAAGWPSSALQLAMVKTSWGEHHLVLVVGGRHVLDNLRGEVYELATSPHTLIRIQSKTNPLYWETP